MRHCHSSRSEEVGRCRKLRVPNICNEVISEVSSICQVENLENRLKISALTNLEVLRHARIQLEERLAAKVVERRECTLAGAQTVPEFYAVRSTISCIARISEGGYGCFQVIGFVVEYHHMRSSASTACPQNVNSSAVAGCVRSC